MNRLVEIRSYKLKPGQLAEFHRAVAGRAVPMLREWGTDVVAFGSSAHEPDTYFLARSYESLDDLNERQNAFYGSSAWRNGPRASVVDRIESYLNTVLWLSPQAIDSMRELNAPSLTLFEALGGGPVVLRLAHAWHERVMADEIVSHAFSHGFHPQHTERLAAYWAEAWGGPAEYSAQYGTETSVVRMHSGHGPHEEMDQRAIACFDLALQDVGVSDLRLQRALHDYFAWSTTHRMSGYPNGAGDVPEGMTILHWSWDGLVQA